MRLLQPSLSRGEVSPEVQARTDLAAYPLGLKTCKNFQISKFGSAENRAGTEFMADYVTGATDNGEAVILTGEQVNFLIPFKPNGADQYTVLITEKYIVPMLSGEFLEADDVGVWVSTTTYNINDYVQYQGQTYVCIANNNLNQTPSNASVYWQHTNGLYYLLWPFWRSVTFRPSRLSFVQSIDTLYICNDHARAIDDDQQGIPPFVLRRASVSPNRWTIKPYNFQKGPFLDLNTDETIKVWASRRTGRVTVTSNKAIFDPLHVDSLFMLEDSTGTGIVRITGFTNSKVVSALVIQKIPSNLTSTSTILTQRGGTLTGNGSTTVFSVTGASSSTASAYLVSVTELFYAGYNEYASYGHQYNMDTTLYSVDGAADQITFTVAPPSTATIEVFENVGTSPINPTSAWAFGSWSPYQGFPELVSFFQDRLVFARTIRQPDTFWMSQAGNLTSHQVTDPVTDASAINRTIASRQVNQINEIVPLDKLMFLTTDVEWVLSAGQNETITPVGISLKPQTAYGAADVNSEIVGNLCVYLQAKTTVIRSVSFTYENNSYTSEDMTLLSSHLFEGHTFRRIAFQKTPNQSVWVLRDDGILLSMTYLPEQDVMAWSRHETTNGEFVDITVIEEDSKDVLYALVRRVIDGDEVIYLERMKQRYFSSIEDAFFVDSGLTYDGRAEIETVGFNLENATYDSSYTAVYAGITPSLGSLHIRRDGTKIFALQISADILRSWVLPDPWVLERINSDKSSTFSVNSEENNPTSFFMKDDGTKFYVVGSTAATVFQYSMPTPWTVETSAYDTVSKLVSAQETNPRGLFFDPTGTKMFILGHGTTATIWQYTLSTPWVVSSASYDSVSLSVAAQDTSAIEIYINDEGTKLFYLGGVSGRVFQYTLPTSFSLTGATYSGVSFLLTDQDSSPTGIYFKPEGDKLYMLGNANDSVYQYSTTSEIIKNMTLTGSGWTVNDSLTLTASGTLNTPFSASNIGDYVKLEIRNSEDEVTADVRVEIVSYTSSTVVTVVPLKDVPAALQGVATSDWVFMVDTISGLDHLEGETVSILADGNVQEQKTVESGEITLDVPGGKVHVGLPIEADLETLEVNVQGAETIRDKQKRIPKVTLLVKESRGFKVGTTFDNLKTAKQRRYEGYEETTELQTGISRVNVATTWQNSGRVCIRQSDPLPVTILGVIPEVEVGEGG